MLVAWTTQPSIPILAVSELLNSVVLYESINEFFEAHLIGLRNRAIRTTSGSPLVNVDAAAMAAAHRTVRHGHLGPLDHQGCEFVAALVAQIDERPEPFRRSAFRELRTHLYDEAVPALLEKYNKTSNVKCLHVLARTPNANAAGALRKLIESGESMPELDDVGVLHTVVVDALRTVVRARRFSIEKRGWAVCTLTTNQQWPDNDVVEALLGDEPSLRGLAINSAAETRVAAAGPILRRLLAQGVMEVENVVWALTRIEGERAFPLVKIASTGSREARYSSVQCFIELGRLEEARKLALDEDVGIASYALLKLGLIGDEVAIAEIESHFRAASPLARARSTDLIDALYLRPSLHGLEAMSRMVRDHEQMPILERNYLSYFVGTLSQHRRREIEPTLDGLLQDVENWTAIAAAAVIFESIRLLPFLRQLSFPDSPRWEHVRPVFEQRVAELESIAFSAILSESDIADGPPNVDE
jgi:hypothetical protein